MDPKVVGSTPTSHPENIKVLLIERRIYSPAMVQEGGRCETEIILSSFWRSGRVVECGGLENRWA